MRFSSFRSRLCKLWLVAHVAFVGACAPGAVHESDSAPEPVVELDLSSVHFVPTSSGVLALAGTAEGVEVVQAYDLGVRSTDAEIGPDGQLWVVAPFAADGQPAREIIALSPSSGRTLKRVELPPQLRRPVGIVNDGDRLLLRSDRDGRSVAIGAVDPTTGRVRLLTVIDSTGGAFGSGIELVDGMLYTFSTWCSLSDDHKIHAVDPQTGRVEGAVPVAGYYALRGARVYTTGYEGEHPVVREVDLPNLRVTRTVRTPDKPLVAASADGVYLAHWDATTISTYSLSLEGRGEVPIQSHPVPGLDAVDDSFRALRDGWVVLNADAVAQYSGPGTSPSLVQIPAGERARGEDG